MMMFQQRAAFRRERDPYWSSTVLLIDGGGYGSAPFLDRTARHSVGGSNGVRSNTFEYAGGGTIVLGGSADLLVSDDADFDLGTGDFTIEWGGVPNSSSRTCFVIQSNSAGADAETSFWVEMSATTKYAHLLVLHGPSGGSLSEITLGAMTTGGAVQHLMVRRSGTTLYCGLNGGAESSVSIGSNSVNNPSQSVSIGRIAFATGQNYLAYLRITKGVARPYGAPTSILPVGG